MNICESIGLSNKDKKNPGKVLEAMESFSKGLIDETLERHAFNLRKQEEVEPFDDLVTGINILSKNCSYWEQCYLGILWDPIVVEMRNDSLRKKLLPEQKLTLDKEAMSICRALEKLIRELGP